MGAVEVQTMKERPLTATPNATAEMVENEMKRLKAMGAEILGVEVFESSRGTSVACTYRIKESSGD